MQIELNVSSRWQQMATTMQQSSFVRKNDSCMSCHIRGLVRHCFVQAGGVEAKLKTWCTCDSGSPSVVGPRTRRGYGLEPQRNTHTHESHLHAVRSSAANGVLQDSVLMLRCC